MSITPMCACEQDEETINHFLLHCESHKIHRDKMIATITTTIPNKNINKDLLLKGDPNLDVTTNKIIIGATMEFIKDSKRFE